jgi:hypothetical protein
MAITCSGKRLTLEVSRVAAKNGSDAILTNSKKLSRRPPGDNLEERDLEGRQCGRLDKFPVPGLNRIATIHLMPC